MRKILFLHVFLLLSVSGFAQENDMRGFTETKIESGSTFKKYEKGKLDSMIVSMVAMNYGNALIFSRTKDEIKITNANDSISVIKIQMKDNKFVKTFFNGNDALISVESIDFDRLDLPKNLLITSALENKVRNNFAIKSRLESFTGEINDKSIKLFYGLNPPSSLGNLDAIFEYLGDFFSEEDALLKIFYGRYAEEIAPPALAYFKTDDSSKINEGILMDYSKEKAGQKHKFEIYKLGKIIKSGSATVDDFQNIFKNYLEKNWLSN